MKKRIRQRFAITLRKLADKTDPAFLREYRIKDEIGLPTHVDLVFRHRRISGYLMPADIYDLAARFVNNAH